MASENYRAPSVAQSAELAEQQGVELPPLPEPRDMGYTTDSVMRTYTMTGYTSEQMQDYARFALAARQPGAQEPVGFQIMRRSADDTCFNGRWDNPPSGFHDDREYYVSRPGTYRIRDIYAAPPAQGIDPGQLRGWLCTSTDGVITDWTMEEESRARFDRMGRTIEPIFAAGPRAQGIDLGQLQLYRMASGPDGVRDLYKDDTGSWVKIQDVERLIGQRDAAPGVAS